MKLRSIPGHLRMLFSSLRTIRFCFPPMPAKYASPKNGSQACGKKLQPTSRVGSFSILAQHFTIVRIIDPLRILLIYLICFIEMEQFAVFCPECRPLAHDLLLLTLKRYLSGKKQAHRVVWYELHLHQEYSSTVVLFSWLTMFFLQLINQSLCFLLQPCLSALPSVDQLSAPLSSTFSLCLCTTPSLHCHSAYIKAHINLHICTEAYLVSGITNHGSKKHIVGFVSMPNPMVE